MINISASKENCKVGGGYFLLLCYVNSASFKTRKKYLNLSCSKMKQLGILGFACLHIASGS